VSVLTLADAKTHLDITKPTWDVELQAMIDAAEGIITDRCGPLAPTSVTDRVWSNGYQIMLRTTPVISLTSLSAVQTSSTADPSLLFVSPAGVITFSDGRSVFYAGQWDVTYVAGRATCPPALLFAVKETLKNLWSTQRGAGASSGGSAGQRPVSRDPMALGPSMLIPPLVREAMEPYVQEFGFA
jgi:hypothetical protein